MASSDASLTKAVEQHLTFNGDQRHGDSTFAGSSIDEAMSKVPAASADLPPTRQKTADEVLAEMKKIPLFMTSLDDMDEDNDQLQAIKALAYEGTRAEQATNFRQQGNECVKSRLWSDAREFYTKALQALKAPRKQPQDPEDGLADARVVEIDEEGEEKEEREIEEACHANRALCNLEMSIFALN